MSLSSFLPKGMMKNKKNPEEGSRGLKRPNSGALPMSFGGSKSAAVASSGNLDRKARKKKNRRDRKRESECDESVAPPVEEQDESLRIHTWSYTADTAAASEEELAAKLPVSDIASLTGHTQLISALCFNKSGSKLASGSYDHTMKMWDFGSMTSSLQPFKTIAPEESYHIHALAYSRGRLLVAPGGAQARLFDKEGEQILECKKGDQYLMDMKNTRGHTEVVTNVSWHPHSRSSFFTSSRDSTLRLWDVNDSTRHTQLIKATNKRGNKTGFATFAIAPDGFMIAGALMDGSLQLWSTKTKMLRPTTVLREAHAAGVENQITAVSFDHQGNQLCSRAGDGTLKLWDSRLLRRPLAVWDSLPSFGPVDCLFSPDDSVIASTTSDGSLLFFSQASLQLINRVKLDKNALSKCIWNERTNQLAVGRYDGSVCILYSDELSQKGVMSCLVKGAKRKAAPTEFTTVQPKIYTDAEIKGAALHDGRTPEERAEAQRRRAASKARRPDIPTLGQHGQVGTSANHELMKKLIGIKEQRVWADPREELLKHDAAAKTDPFFFGSAYATTQPVTLFSKPEEADGEETESQAAPQPDK